MGYYNWIHTKYKHEFISTKAVYSIRISAELYKMMEKMKEINWQGEIRNIVEESVKNMKVGVSSAEIIKEYRDTR